MSDSHVLGAAVAVAGTFVPRTSSVDKTAKRLDSDVDIVHRVKNQNFKNYRLLCCINTIEVSVVVDRD